MYSSVTQDLCQSLPAVDLAVNRYMEFKRQPEIMLAISLPWGLLATGTAVRLNQATLTILEIGKVLRSLSQFLNTSA